MPEAAVKALIEEDGRFLALKTDADGGAPRWGLPGGRVEHGESPHAALHREVRESIASFLDGTSDARPWRLHLQEEQGRARLSASTYIPGRDSGAVVSIDAVLDAPYDAAVTALRD